ncbi:MAG: ABC transporter ATP-binding protein [Nitrospirae bacterium]|nr:ABC transporter ATP-binding protein [Nitrospirota bacterium]
MEIAASPPRRVSASGASRLTPNASPLTANESAYQVERLRFRYRKGSDAHGEPEHDGDGWVLKGLTFEVRAGEIVGVIGPNGSGKTSLLKLLARILRPHEGALTLFGRAVAGLQQAEVARTVALVPQESPILFPFTITEMVLMGRFPHHRIVRGLSGFGWEGPEDIRLAEEAMQETDVAHLADRLISDVSGGERQRAVIARALTQQPRVLLLDEPTAFLDLHHQLDICRILRRLNEERGLTVVLVSHDLNLASQYCDRLLLLNEGEVYRMGPPSDVIRPDVLEAVYRCQVLVDHHPLSGLPRVTLPGRLMTSDVRREASGVRREA